jgi:hypothetical protein
MTTVIRNLYDWVLQNLLGKRQSTFVPRATSNNRPSYPPQWRLATWTYAPVHSSKYDKWMDVWDRQPIGLVIRQTQMGSKGIWECLNLHYADPRMLNTILKYRDTAAQPGTSALRRGKILETIMALALATKGRPIFRRYRLSSISNFHYLTDDEMSDMHRALTVLYPAEFRPNPNERRRS